jgi:DNA mismatch repair protein MutS2
MPSSSSFSESFDLEALEFRKTLDLFQRFLTTGMARVLLGGLGPFGELSKAQEALAQAREMGEWLEAGGRLRLPALPDLLQTLERVWTGAALESKTLAELLKGLRTVVRARRMLVALEGRPALQRLGERLPEMDVLLGYVEERIDDDGEVLASASVKLSELRHAKKEGRRSVEQALQRLLESASVRKALQSPQIVWRAGRPALQVKPEMRRLVPGILHDRSQSGQTVFIEPQGVVEKVNRLAEVDGEIQAEITRILAELRQRLHQDKERLTRGFQGVAWVDFTLARGCLVRELGFTVPEMVEEGALVLREARHPLLLRSLFEGRATMEEVKEGVVPLDLRLGDPFGMLIITGPNTGGKTIALKTVGLLTLLAQSGIPIPAAKGSQIRLVDGIYADIGDEQAVEQSLSTFSSHLVRIARALDRASPKSLVLLDELGAGTDPEEGGALGYAILETLLRRKVPTIVSTHLGKLKDFAYQHEGVENGSMAFDSEKLEPLYRLELGLPGESQALHVAGKIGIEAEIVERARSLLGQRDRSVEEMIDNIQKTRRAAERQRRQAEDLQQSIEGSAAEVRELRAQLDLREKTLREEAEHFVEEELRAARDLLAEPLKDFRNAPAPFGERAKGMLKLIEGLLSRTTLGRRREKFLEGVKKGHMVYVPKFNRKCKVLKIDRKRRLIVAEVGAMRMDLPFDEISWLQPLDL